MDNSQISKVDTFWSIILMPSWTIQKRLLLCFCDSQPQTEQCLDEISRSLCFFLTLCFFFFLNKKCQTWPYNEKECVWVLVASHILIWDHFLPAGVPALIKPGFAINLFWTHCSFQNISSMHILHMLGQFLWCPELTNYFLCRQSFCRRVSSFFQSVVSS